MSAVEERDLERLRQRVSRLAQEKSRLQLIIRMMTRVGSAAGSDSTVEAVVSSLADILGGTNVAVYFVVDDEIRYRDAFGTSKAPAPIDDEQVLEVFRTRHSVDAAHDFSETKMLTPQFSQARTWVYPLIVGPDLIGVLKLENLHFDMRELQPELSLFLSYVALTIKSAIIGEQRLKQAYLHLTAANKELEAFAYSVSHDLRAPLRAIEGYGQALLEDYGDRLDDTAQHYLSGVRSGSQRMSGLIEAMLQMSRLTRGELFPQTVDLSCMVAEIAETLKLAAPERNVEFVIAQGVEVTADPRLLRSVMENLIGNAWKFTGNHPEARIEFGVTRRAGEPVYFVRDDGAGFDMTQARQLFTPFRRLHAPEEFPGNGIGLATVQRLVHRHGGRVWAEGAVEHGATFSFTLGRGQLTDLA